MLRSLSLSLLVVLALTASLSFAEDKAGDAAALIARAQQLSDIRAEGSSPFRLEAKIMIVADDGTINKGAYVETWASPEMWRTDISAGGLVQTEVAKDRKISVLSTWPLVTDFISPRITAAHEHLLGFHMDGNWPLLDYKPSKIEDRTSKSWSLRCIDVNNPFGWTSELCFDRERGLLLAKSSTKKDAPYACTYLDYQKFGGKLFPRSIQCLKNGRAVLQGTITALTKLESPDLAEFTALHGGRELSHCPHVGIPGQVRAANVMSFHSQNQWPIEMAFVLGADARPHDAVLVHSTGSEKEDRRALDSLKNWSFKAASCDGTPVSSEMQIVDPNLAAHGIDSRATPPGTIAVGR